MAPDGTCDIQKSMMRALTYLTSAQHRDGSFPLWRTTSTSSESIDPLFATACILLAIGHQLPRSARHAALRYVAQHRAASGHWTFDIAGQLPADADDTACCTAALARFSPSLLGPPADAVGALQCFRRRDGTLMTWYPGTENTLSGRATDDVVVVANVLYAVAILAPPTARSWLAGLLTRVGTSGGREAVDPRRPLAFGAPYYLHVETVAYAWNRLLRALGLPEAQQPLPDQARSPIQLALAIAATGYAADGDADALLAAQQPDGSWAGEAWFRAPRASFGSPALTTALAAEALDRLQQGARSAARRNRSRAADA